MSHFSDIPDFDDLPDHVKEHVIKTRKQATHPMPEEVKKDEPEPVQEIVKRGPGRPKMVVDMDKKEE